MWVGNTRIASLDLDDIILKDEIYFLIFTDLRRCVISSCCSVHFFWYSPSCCWSLA